MSDNNPLGFETYPRIDEENAAEMSKTQFKIAYDGPSLADGSMDVRDLAPALLAAGKLFESANAFLNGDRAKVRVDIRATEIGSFEILLEVVQSWSQQAKDMLSGDWVTAAINLKEILITGAGGVGGLIWLVKKLRGRNPDSIEAIDPDTVRISFDGEYFVVPLQLLRLYREIAVRRALEELISVPLEKEGIDEFLVIEGTRRTISVVDDEAKNFRANIIEDENIILDSTVRSAYSIISLAFKDKNKWRLESGSGQINATIEDRDFIEKINSNQIAFAKGDILVCDVRVVQRQTVKGLRTEHTILHVVDHRRALRQLSIPGLE